MELGLFILNNPNSNSLQACLSHYLNPDKKIKDKEMLYLIYLMQNFDSSLVFLYSRHLNKNLNIILIQVKKCVEILQKLLQNNNVGDMVV